jgi:GT2 family glycosyltransferase
LSRENKGLVSTLNEAIALASGEAICLLASDDYLPPGSLSSRARLLQRKPETVAVFGDGIKVYGDRQSDERILDDRRRRLFAIKDPVPEFIMGLNLPIHLMMARRSVLMSLGGFDPRYRRCEDLEIQLRLFLAGPVEFVEHSVYCYREHQSNTSRVNPYVARGDKVLCYRKYLEEIPELAPYRKQVRYRLRRQYLLLGRYLRKTGQGTPFEKELFKGGWEFAWQDVRLLWHLLFWSLTSKDR